MNNMNDIRCPRCNFKLAEKQDNGTASIIAIHTLSHSKGRISCWTSNEDMGFTCVCDFMGLYSIQEGWTHSAMQVYDFE
jgi:hypothetical protein